jgi:hypothetical protein
LSTRSTATKAELCSYGQPLVSAIISIICKRFDILLVLVYTRVSMLKSSFSKILVAGFIGAVLGSALYFGSLIKYKSLGVLSLEATLAEHKRFDEVLSNRTSISKFLGLSKASEGARDAIAKLTLQPDPLKDALVPIFRLSKADLKELGEAPKEAISDPRQVLGVRLSIVNASPAIAQESVTLLATYVRQELLRYQLAENVSVRTNKLRQDVPRLENETLAEKFSIEQVRTKITALQKLVEIYPRNQLSESRQVINVDRNNERYLSPTSQLIAAESEAVQIRQNLVDKERELRMAGLELEFLAASQAPIAAEVDGSELAKKLTALVDKVLRPKAEKEEWARVVLNRTLMDIDTASERFLNQTRFISDPSLPVRPERPGPSTVILGLAALLALLTAMFIFRDALVRFLLGSSRDAPDQT